MSKEVLRNGLVRSSLRVGTVFAVTPSSAKLSLPLAAGPSAIWLDGSRYGRGEVGELVVLEGQTRLLLGRLVEVHAPESDRDRGFDHEVMQATSMGTVQLLGSIDAATLRVTPGVDSFPRVGDAVFSCPHELLGELTELMLHPGERGGVLIDLGSPRGAPDARVRVRPEKLFGRHCAILGSTGGGKSWTVARLLEECARLGGKAILLDATGEYRSCSVVGMHHVHLGKPVETAPSSDPVRVPPTDFTESDFIALFEPSGKVQGPKLREAMRSLRVQAVKGERVVYRKADQPKKPFADFVREHAARVNHPRQAFETHLLAEQVVEECVWPQSNSDPTRWGSRSDSDYSWCLSLVTRITAITRSDAFEPVFGTSGGEHALSDVVAKFLGSTKPILRVCLSGVSYEFGAREFIVNAIGRALMVKARAGEFRQRPLLVFVDEAHNFLGRTVGADDYATKLDSFELIAREGRKYGLNLCLATQRPRDLSEGVLSQMGTLVVHRTTHDRDREVIEKSASEIDRHATGFLASLRPGEAALLGVDFPVPITVQVAPPVDPPRSDGPPYQKAWAPQPPTDETGTTGGKSSAPSSPESGD